MTLFCPIFGLRLWLPPPALVALTTLLYSHITPLPPALAHSRTDGLTDGCPCAAELLITRKMLLLLPVFLAFTRANELKVVSHPYFPTFYVSDVITLLCKNGHDILKNDVKWLKNLTEFSSTPSITVMLRQSVSYSCESGGRKSGSFNINVLNLVPKARLSNTGRKAVIGRGDAVVLRLHVEDTLTDWWCRYTKDFTEYWTKPQQQEMSNHTALIHASIQGENSTNTTYWCMNTKSKQRSNAVTLRATGRIVMLQVPEGPVSEGENVHLRCEVWGGAHVDQAVFYQNGKKLPAGTKDTYDINNITMSSDGLYKCDATYRFIHISKSASAHHSVYSDEQVLQIIAGPPVATLVHDSGILRCKCPQCDSPGSHQWWYRVSGGSASKLSDTSADLQSRKEGFYTCRAAFENGFSRFSNEVLLQVTAPDLVVMLVVVAVVLAVALCLVLAVCYWKRRRNTQMFGGKKVKELEDGADGGYELIDVEKGGRNKGQGEAEYEPLKGPQTQVYHTLKGQGEGQGGYEPLKGPQTQVYHTLKGQGEGQGKEQAEGEYDLLKDPQAQVYHSLKGQGEGQGEGQGGYEPLKGPQAQVYHSLKGQGEGQGGYEPLKGPQTQVYHTLKGQGESQTAQAEVHHTLQAGPVKGQEEGAGQAEGGYECLPLKEPDDVAEREKKGEEEV
ncbi:uncharacterized protein LOC113590149 isoform X4 [Electrophorus electricus]|uniref:uncharacterized protein LOC113590149 isoform X3 n=1 Tax=Electrophorus electricus TaxID=8005 RepID=UPI0015D02319|nr:uncharacterized protein LOC113590149 isoform X3 [Electrophorus electricus]XP_035387124.1 uncharacterized protein LOC113590149 isoform X4 [Electrophorus electricus]